jgi:hypothetical protein
MTIFKILTIAKNHLGKGAVMDSSARMTWLEAAKWYEAGNMYWAGKRAMKSLAYSIGIFHPEYAMANEMMEGYARA